MNDFIDRLKKMVGYDLHTSRVAFHYENREIAFIHDFFIMRRRIYVDGEQVFSRFSQYLGLITDADFTYKGDHYRIITRTSNIISMRQDVTLWINGQEVGRKQIPFYGAMSTEKKIHAVLGAMSFGVLIGIVISVVF